MTTIEYKKRLLRYKQTLMRTCMDADGLRVKSGFRYEFQILERECLDLESDIKKLEGCHAGQTIKSNK